MGIFTTTEDGTEQGLGDLDTLINCSSTGCLVSQDLIDAALNNPRLLLGDSTRLVQHVISTACSTCACNRTNTCIQPVGMTFTELTTDSLAAKLGFSDRDVILDVEGLPFIDESDFLAVALEIYDAPTVTVTVDRNGTTHELMFTRY